jgi:hypothetical protein
MPLRAVVDTELFQGDEVGRGCAMCELKRLARTLERNQGDILGRLRAGCARNGYQQRQARWNDLQESAQEMAKLKHLVALLGAEWRSFQLPPQRLDCKGAAVRLHGGGGNRG